jgi:hypothetical protein
MLKYRSITSGHLLQDASLDKHLPTLKLVIRTTKKLIPMVLSLHLNMLNYKLLTCGLRLLDASLDKLQLTSRPVIRTTKKLTLTVLSLHLNMLKFNFQKNSDLPQNASTQIMEMVLFLKTQRLSEIQFPATLMTQPTLVNLIKMN